MQYYGSTDQGIRRGSNQDAFLLKTSGNLLIATVCDGMGGANGGNVASAIAVETYTKKLAKYITSALSFVYLGDIPEFGEPCEDFPEIPLSELAAKHNPPITKSGLNHRLKKLLALAGKE